MIVAVCSRICFADGIRFSTGGNKQDILPVSCIKQSVFRSPVQHHYQGNTRNTPPLQKVVRQDEKKAGKYLIF